MSEFVFSHKTVLLNETVDGILPRKGGIYVDGTLGGGGHTSLLCKKIGKGTVIGIDQDVDALSKCKRDLQHTFSEIIFVHNNFKNIKSVLANLSIEKIDGAFLDLGVSSYQLDNPERGFSYMKDAPLDMRMNRQGKVTAFDVVNTYEKDSLFSILRDYGEEKFASLIAANIVKEREQKPIETTLELVSVVEKSIPAKFKAAGGHPAKRTFQAIRIEVNEELSILKNSVHDFFDCLAPGGRLAIITFHSLEDRIVKTAFKELSTGCICPPEFPVCVCGRKPAGSLVNKKPILPSKEETENNSRAKSAKLRIIEKNN